MHTSFTSSGRDSGSPGTPNEPSGDESLLRDHAWWIYLALVVPLALLYLLGPDAVNVGPVFNLIGASAFIAILVGARTHRPHRPVAWYLLACGQALFVAGDVVAYNYTRFFGEELPFPSFADPLYLSVYPALIAGVLILVHQRTPRHDRASLIDSLIVATGIGFVSWVFLISKQVHDGSSAATTVISVAYPLMDLVLLGVVVRLALGSGRRPVSFFLLVAGGLCLVGTDSVYGWLQLGAGYTPGGLLDGGWIVFYVLWAAAALHPSMGALSVRSQEHENRLTRARLALLAGATLMVPSMQTLLFLGDTVDLLVVTSSSVILFSLVLVRMSGLVRHQEASARRERALREAGAALVTATNRAEISNSLMTATRTLVGADRPVTLYLTASGGDLRRTAAVGEGLAPPRMSLSDLWPEALSDLRSRSVARVDMRDLSPEMAVGDDAGKACVAPLLIRDEITGLLVVETASPCPLDTKEALVSLGVEAALALESASLTEDLLRRRSEARFRSLIQHSSDLVTVVSGQTRILFSSPSVERMLGLRPEDLEGTLLTELVHPRDRNRLSVFLRGMLDEAPDRSSAIEFRMRHRGGEWIHLESSVTNLSGEPEVGGLVLNARDVSERKAFEQQLSHQAFHDAVTGLPNRALFRDRVEHALNRQSRVSGTVAVLFLDIDDFKTINDSLGHGAGDDVLREVGARLAGSIRASDTAARLGGDEFAVLMDGTQDEFSATELAERILDSLTTPLSIDGKEILVRASVGIAFGDADGGGAGRSDELLRDADVAMYMAKQNGKGGYQLFEPAMHSEALERLNLKTDLQRAVDEGEFVVHYQPIVDLRTRRLVGAEALVRWEHPERGLVPPLDFIPLAEETGLVVPMGRIVLEAACNEAVELQRLCPQDPPLSMSVNLSARQLQRAELPDEVSGVLESTGLAPSSLILEITESVMMEDMDLSLLRLQQLRNLGVRLAVDDFGTGYSSLSYIRRFPFDLLKVDKSFIDGLEDGGSQMGELTATIIGLARTLELEPIAEGIESAEQISRLRRLGCDLGQGYVFHRPLPGEQIEEVAAANAAARIGVRCEAPLRSRG